MLIAPVKRWKVYLLCVKACLLAQFRKFSTWRGVTAGVRRNTKIRSCLAQRRRTSLIRQLRVPTLRKSEDNHMATDCEDLDLHITADNLAMVHWVLGHSKRGRTFSTLNANQRSWCTTMLMLNRIRSALESSQSSEEEYTRQLLI
jgi:hypothetical protein